MSAVHASAAVQLTIRDGRVWLRTDQATVAEILREWGRVGRTQVVNGDRLSGGAPLSLVLEGVPEREAIAIVLRSAAGYLTMNRATGDGNESQFRRIVIVVSSNAPSAGPIRAADPPTVTAAQSPLPADQPSGAQRIIGADGQPVPDDQDGAPPPPSTRSIPPGFSPQPEPPPATAAPQAAPAPVGVPRPGMVPGPLPPKKPGEDPPTGS